MIRSIQAGQLGFVSATFSALLLCVTASATAQQATAAGGGNSAGPTVNECLTAHREAQSLRKQLKLRETRELLGECSNDACPAPVKRDCLRWTDEIAQQTPSVVFRVDLGDYPPTTRVKVIVDDEPLFDTLPNRAVELNPGDHKFRIVLENGKSIEQDVTLGEGEKFRNVFIKFESEAKPVQAAGQAGAQPAQPLPAQPPGIQERPIPVASYIFAGIGVVGLGVFTGYGLWSESLRKELKNECAPNCEQSYIDKVRNRGYIADVGLGIGVASLATATVLYFTRPTITIPGKLDVGVLPQGGFIGTYRFADF